MWGRLSADTLCICDEVPETYHFVLESPTALDRKATVPPLVPPSTMSAEIYPPYPPTLTRPEEEYLLSNLKDWSIAHGLAVRPVDTYVSKEVDPAGALATTAPVTLFPSLFPRSCFEQAKAVSKAYNELYSAIAVDEAWLGEICKE